MTRNYLQVKIVARSDVVITALSATDSSVQLVKSLVDVNKGVDHSSPVHGWKLKMAIRDREGRRWGVRWQVQVKGVSEFHPNLIEGLIGPVTKPIQDASVEKRWRGCRS
jgi:hypothetical protein